MSETPVIRIEIEVSVPGQTNDVMGMAAYVTQALVSLQERGTVVHRITIEEADA